MFDRKPLGAELTVPKIPRIRVGRRTAYSRREVDGLSNQWMRRIVAETWCRGWTLNSYRDGKNMLQGARARGHRDNVGTKSSGRDCNCGYSWSVSASRAKCCYY